MNPFDFPVARLALLLILGIVIGKIFHIMPQLALGLSGFSLLLLALAYRIDLKKPLFFGICVALNTISLGALTYSLSREINQAGHYQEYDYTGQRLWHLKIRETGKHTSFYNSYTAQILSLDEEPARGKIALRIKKTDKGPLKVDDELLVWGTAIAPGKALNPYQWDYARYLERENIYHQIKTGPAAVYTLGILQPTILGWASRLRTHLINKLEQLAIPENEMSIIKALLLGDRDNISQETFDQYRKAGAIHILAISGLHVGIILLLLRFLFRPLNRFTGGRTMGLVLTVTILWGYAFLAGFGPSVIRAVAMFSFLAYSLFLNRITHGYNTLSLSMFFLLLVIDPSLVFEVGFQMSYAAVWSILWAYPILTRLWKPKGFILKRLWQLTAVSLAAQLGVLPISLFYFHQFPGLFLLSSAVIVPFLGLILGGGFLLTFLGLINGLPEIFIQVYTLLIFNLNEFVGWVSRQDAFHLDQISFGPMELILTYFLIYFLIRFLQKPKAQKLSYALLFLVLIQVLGIGYAGYGRTTQHLFIVHQYGDAILLRQQGQELNVMISNEKPHASLIRNYQIGARTKQTTYSPLGHSYNLNGRSLIRLDSSNILMPDRREYYLWLSHAPRINLDRYLDYARPQQIIADGSSPPYLVKRWKKSALDRDIPFHYTGKEGAFEFNQ